MLHTGALGRYKVLVIIWGKVMETADAKKIADWIKRGGHLIVMDVPEFEDIDRTDKPENILFGNDKASNHKMGSGQVVRVYNWGELISALRKTLSGLHLPLYDLTKDSIYSTQIDKKRWLFFNNTERKSTYQLILPGDKQYKMIVKPEAITEMELDKDHSKIE
jgi:hypothetical protein